MPQFATFLLRQQYLKSPHSVTTVYRNVVAFFLPGAMEKKPAKLEGSFITFTTPNDMNNAKARKLVASHVWEVRRRRKQNATKPQTDQIVQSFLRWRNSSAPAESYFQDRACPDSIPACLYTSPSLQQCKLLRHTHSNHQFILTRY